ncbi:MAG: type III PLP-dependent enzyme [Gammaproteobacteria bacterium]|jgi:ornithine decarboxylase|nr:type III PLP-dependent enzyme [Gammaproteobacteria bacterium]NBR17098.1 type III PLP-dependent enzyme [Gammaproteobacteria bacterium]NCW20970.1 type III PLP-dependent enzyme [Gammaproteobacteria bacterium]NCW57044.1 type III PLP-dependent enzyme [Gammaproteobacteria bacterium]NDA41991.1 type III PLP-dependent enzyme [Gammaproteobacteria bacterium]
MKSTRKPPYLDPFQPREIRRLVGEFGSPLLIVDCERIRGQYRELQRALPGVDLHYALKPLPHPAVVRTVLAEGGFLDLATTGEVELVHRMGVDPKLCIHTHPIKRDVDIRSALERGVCVFVADNPDELRKFVPYADRAELLLRVSFRSPGAVSDLSRKFGCDPEALLALARRARDLGIVVRGLSFHVGSQAPDPGKHVEAIEACTRLLTAARRERLGPCDTLDIGGGFPIDYAARAPQIGYFCKPIRAALAKLPKRIRVIAEPGRYIAGPSAIGVASVMGRARREGRWWYYLDDGLYGSFSGQLFDHARYPLESLKKGRHREPAVLAGPTCDSIDVITENILLPELDEGDLLVGRAMGAYTWASASEFNFFPRATVVSVNLEPGDRGSVLAVTEGFGARNA